MTAANESGAIAEVYAWILSSRQITHRHRRILMEVICSAQLSHEERSAIDRLLWATRRGHLELVDE